MPVYFSKQQTVSGGKGQVPLLKVVGWSVADHLDLLDEVCQLPKSQWSSHWPGDEETWDFNSKRLPRLLVRSTQRDMLMGLGAVGVENPYYELVAVRLKTELWKHQHPDWNTGVGADQDPERKMWVRSGAKEHFRKKERAVVRQLYNSGVYVHNVTELVSSTEARTDRLRTAIKKANVWVENLDLGHRFQVKHTPKRIDEDEMDSESGSTTPNQGTTPKTIAQELHAMSRQELEDVVAAKPWYKPVAVAEGLLVD